MLGSEILEPFPNPRAQSDETAAAEVWELPAEAGYQKLRRALEPPDYPPIEAVLQAVGKLLE